MAKSFSCRDVGVDCDFEATGETEQEVLDKCLQHAREEHQLEEIPPELAQQVRSKIRNV